MTTKRVWRVGCLAATVVGLVAGGDGHDVPGVVDVIKLFSLTLTLRTSTYLPLQIHFSLV
jgi:hypothetical protein